MAHRFEGYPYDRISASLTDPGLDVGASYQRSGPCGNAYVEYLQDASGNPRGGEMRLGYG